MDTCFVSRKFATMDSRKQRRDRGWFTRCRIEQCRIYAILNADMDHLLMINIVLYYDAFKLEFSVITVFSGYTVFCFNIIVIMK